VATLEPKPLPKVVTVTPPTIIEPVVPAPPVKAATPSLVTKPNVTPPPAKVESGVMDDLLENPTALGGGALLAILVGAFAVFRTRSRKKKIAFENTGIADTSLKANSLFGTTGGQSVDTSNSVFNSSFAPAASTLDSNEVDPVAEADVYIAYGRDVQAEEILKEALRTHPDRHAIRVKLLEIYNNRKDARAFESVATELYSMSKGEGDEWAQAAAMGIVLDPTNELYASGVGAATIANPLSASFASESKLTPQPPLKDASELEALLAEIAVNESSEPSERTPIESASATNSVDNSRTINPIDTADLASRLNSPSKSSPPVNSTSSIDNSLDFAAGSSTAKIEAGKADTSKIENNIAGTTKAESNSTNKETIKAKAGEPAAQQADAATAAAIKMAEIDLNFLDPIPTAPAETALTVPTPNKGEIQTDPKTGMKISSEPVALTADQSLIKSQPDTITSKVPVPSNVDVSSLGDFAIDPIPTGAAQSTLDNQALEFDLSGITLDLPDNLPGDTGATALPSAQSTYTAKERTLGQDQLKSLDLDTKITSHDAAALDLMSNHAEMATKLDLAVAYQEIGDHEGARELLDEVCKNGNDEQSEKAKSMLEHMA
jgi:pilus assembly protein FimV